jgi:hypothetical protein
MEWKINFQEVYVFNVLIVPEVTVVVLLDANKLIDVFAIDMFNWQPSTENDLVG